jgi:hypothetical protein
MMFNTSSLSYLPQIGNKKSPANAAGLLLEALGLPLFFSDNQYPYQVSIDRWKS